ncbi:DNA-binding protein [Roseateles sp.]|uniref:DNA-binding protein n=1 Tax=Roseateles sp. TaxID=1971397 RepID=UPI0031E0D04B
MEEFEISQSACRAAKNSFFARGEQISTWAEKHGFSKDLVYSVLAGRAKGHRGQAHRIAVALGLKPLPADNPEIATHPGRET